MNKRLLHVSIICLTLLISFFQIHISVKAKSMDDIEKKIKEIEEEQKQIEKERSNIENEKKKTNSKLRKNKKEQTSVKDEINNLEQSISETKDDIEAKEKEIDSLNDEIEKLIAEEEELEKEIDDLHYEIDRLNEEIEELEERIEKREEILRERLRSMQNGGGPVSYLEVILGSQSFTDFISRTTAVTTIMKQDHTLINEHQEDKQSLESHRTSVEKKNEQLKENHLALVENRKDIEQNKLDVEAEKQNLIALKDELDEQSSEKDKLLAKLEEEEEELVDFELSLEEEEKIIAAQNAALEDMKKEETNHLNQLKATNKTNKDTNSSDDIPTPTGDELFIEPTNGKLTSKFGMRYHPIHKENRMHNGIDIANNSKTNIKAAAPGRVITSEFNESFGNYVVILHSFDDEIYATLYAHMNSSNVSPGQEVQAGEVIGTMGSTGASTGAHLHFEVHKGGYQNQLVNPLDYMMNTGLIKR